MGVKYHFEHIVLYNKQCSFSYDKVYSWAFKCNMSHCLINSNMCFENYMR